MTLFPILLTPGVYEYTGWEYKWGVKRKIEFLGGGVQLNDPPCVSLCVLVFINAYYRHYSNEPVPETQHLVEEEEGEEERRIKPPLSDTCASPSQCV